MTDQAELNIKVLGMMTELLDNNSFLLCPENRGNPLVVGLGVDIIDIAEMERLSFDRFGAFYRRCFTVSELDYCQAQANPAQHLAARFAAKEAAIKAFSSLRQLAPWQIEVVRQDNGAPYLRLWDVEGGALLRDLAGYSALVSMSHSVTQAMAVVIVQNQAGVTHDVD